jgi:hypothetical protein
MISSIISLSNTIGFPKIINPVRLFLAVVAYATYLKTIKA